MSTPPVALVTGSGARRVGRRVAEALAGRGYSLVVHYRESAAEAAEAVADFRARGVGAVAVRADLTDEHAVQGLVDAALGEFGRLDVLVNCAAIWERKRLEDVTADDVRRHFEANALGTFLCSRAAGLHMAGRPEGGVVVTVGDAGAARPGVGYAAYYPSKGAIPALTRSLAVELGTRNPAVRVNCVLPGSVMTSAAESEAERRLLAEATLVKRQGRPDHVASAVLFFLDNDFVTGACLTVDGGRDVFAPGAL